MPTGELVTTMATSIIRNEEEERTNFHHWSRLIAGNRFLNTWVNKEFPAIRLSLDELNDEMRFHMVATLRTGEIPDGEIQAWGGRSGHSYVGFTCARLNGVLASHSAIAFLHEARRTLVLTRDRLKSADPARRRVMKTLNYIQEFFEKSLQVPNIADELEKKSSTVHSYAWSCSGFIEASPRDKNQPLSIAEGIRSHTNYLAKRVIAEDASIREHFQQISAIMSTRESVRAQRRMEFLTLLATALAGVSVWLATPSFDKWPANFQSAVKALGLLDEAKK